MKPLTCDLNRTPSSTAFASLWLVSIGEFASVQMLHGQMNGTVPTTTEMPAPGVSRLPLSSTARLLITTGPWADGVHTYDQFSWPMASFHVTPPSTDTSTPATAPPGSPALPLIVKAEPTPTVAPPMGDAIVDAGGVVSDDPTAGMRPASIVVGCTPMSAKRLIVACCMAGLAGVPGNSCSASRPHDHCAVPAPKTSAVPRRYSVRWWVAVPGAYTLP